LLSQNYISESGDATIKYFFPEGRFAASVGAMLSRTSSKFSVIAVEDTRVLSYDFSEFKKLTEQYRDIASFLHPLHGTTLDCRKRTVGDFIQTRYCFEAVQRFFGCLSQSGQTPQEASDCLVFGHYADTTQPPLCFPEIKLPFLNICKGMNARLALN
jgi:hypothetical protein